MTSSNLTSNQLYDTVSNSGIRAQKKKGNQGIEETQQSIGGGSGGAGRLQPPSLVDSLKLKNTILESSSKR